MILCCSTGFSADEVVVVIEIESETRSVIETLFSEHNVGVWELIHSCSIFDESQVLELLDCRGSSILLSVVERIIFLGHLKTEDGIADEDCECYN